MPKFSLPSRLFFPIIVLMTFTVLSNFTSHKCINSLYTSLSFTQFFKYLSNSVSLLLTCLHLPFVYLDYSDNLPDSTFASMYSILYIVRVMFSKYRPTDSTFFLKHHFLKTISMASHCS